MNERLRTVMLRKGKDARQRIDVLVLAGTFMPNTIPRIARMLTDRANAGVQIRLCFGDPRAEATRVRDDEEKLHGTLGPKIEASLTYYRELVDVDRCQIRLHAATLYASLFRYDNNLLVNPHIWGSPASANPTLHLRRIDGGEWFDRYMDSFDAVWDSAAQWPPDERRPDEPADRVLRRPRSTSPELAGAGVEYAGR